MKIGDLIIETTVLPPNGEGQIVMLAIITSIGKDESVHYYDFLNSQDGCLGNDTLRIFLEPNKEYYRIDVVES